MVRPPPRSTALALAECTRPIQVGRAGARRTAPVARFVADLRFRWEGDRVLVIGHVATVWGLDRFIAGSDLSELVAAEFVWQEGREYRLE